MKMVHRTVVSGEKEWVRVKTDSVEYCCEPMQRSFGQFIDYVIDPDFIDEPVFVGIVTDLPPESGDAFFGFGYCPFCGEEIELEDEGRFKKVTEEVPIE